MACKSPLNNLHKKLGAKFTEFAGFEMPIYFSSINEEHLTVRKSVGLFDVSHMSNVWITGKDAEKLISYTTVEDASRIKNEMSQYTAILREDGTRIGVIRIKPSSVLWKPSGERQFYSITLERFEKWITHRRTGAERKWK